MPARVIYGSWRTKTGKNTRVAAALEVTTEFLLSETVASPGEAVIDEAFYRKYKNMHETTKKQIRKILASWNDE